LARAAIILPYLAASAPEPYLIAHFSCFEKELCFLPAIAFHSDFSLKIDEII
jgi:hypothetical protein